MLKKKVFLLTMLLCLIGFFATACKNKITDVNDYSSNNNQQSNDFVTHYIIGYNTGCGGYNAIDTANGIGKSNVGIFLAVSRDLKDTLAILDFPDDLFNFPSTIVYPFACLGFNLFPEEYRLKYGIRMDYKVEGDYYEACPTLYMPCNNIIPHTVSIISISAAGGSHWKSSVFL